MDVLVKLAEHAGATVSKDEIIAAAWSTHVVSDHSVATAISDLRRALNDDPRNAQIIETVPKRGYRLIASVSKVTQEVDVPVVDNVSAAAFREFVGSLTHKIRPIATIFVIGITILVAAIHGMEDSAGPNNPGPIVVGDICTGEVDSATEDLAYGFGELLTIALAQDLGRSVVRIADENAYQSKGGGSDAPILLDSSIIQTANESLIVLEISNGRTRELIWGGKFPITSETIELSAINAADDILSAISPTRTARLNQ